jgi:osmotically-inducible protein OsmY
MNDRYGWDDHNSDGRNSDNRERWRRPGESSPRLAQDDAQRSHDRWRSEDDDWRSPSGRSQQGRADFDREQRYGGASNLGYGSQGRDTYGAGQQVHASQSDQSRRAYSSSDYGYGSGQQGDAGSQRYFTGQQQGFEVPSSYRAPGTFGASYGGGTGTYSGGAGGYGEDYRDHGYASRQHERGFLQRAGDEVASWFGDDDAARRREQDHRGRGPADYTRSDERIREDANDRLTEDWRVDASRVSVAVDQGEITLSGTVLRREDKRRAEDVVEDISGVKHIQNNLRVQQDTAWSGGSSTGAATASVTTNAVKSNT